MENCSGDKLLPLDIDGELTRSEFIGKVYRLLALSLLTGAGGAMAGIALNIGADLYWPLVALEFAVLFFVWNVRHDKSKNLFALFTFTIITGLTLSYPLNCVIRAGMGDMILLASALTLGLFAALSTYVHQSRIDFSFMEGFLFTGLWMLLVASLLFLFFPDIFSFNSVILAYFGLLLFSGYILYDTSRLIHKLGTDDYIEITLSLYLDTLNIFIDILRILVDSARSIDISDLDIDV